MNYHFIGEDAIPSPALIYYRDLIEANTRLTVRMAGDPERLWPHIKTHKMAQMLKKHIYALKELPHPFGIYLHSFQKNGMTQHCVLDAPEFQMGDISPMEWLWNAVNGDVMDVGLDLLK